VTPEGVASAAAIGLAVVLAWAAVAKVANRRATVESFTELGLVAPSALVWAVAVAELVAAVLLVLVPVAGAALAVVLLVAFTVVLFRALRSGLVVGCACFGAVSDRSISPLDLARNVGLVLAAHFAFAAPSPVRPDLGGVVLVAAVGLLGAWSLRTARVRMDGERGAGR
jgi:uncharacterized membrane protein YphA (DoxX/SURF4 family)